MREVLRVLRGLYSARHYRRSFLVYEFLPRPFSHLFLTLLLSLATSGYFLRLSPPALPSLLLRFFYYFLPQLSTQGHYVTGTMAANEDCGERLLIPCSKLHGRLIETARLSITTFSVRFFFLCITAVVL